MPAGRLGRGVSALFSGDSATFEHSARLVPIAYLHPNPEQPRRTFNQARLAELAASIRHYGIIQPLIVEERGLNDYIIIAGERRYRAAQQANVIEIPIICRQSEETERFELALVENIQRADLNVLEEAQAYRSLLKRTRLTQEELAARVGKSRSTVANVLRILALPDRVQRLVADGQLTAGHARAVLVLPTPHAQQRIADEIVRRKLSVRESEQLAQARSRVHEDTGAAHSSENAMADKVPPKNYELTAVEGKIRERLLTAVRITGNGEKGMISIYYHSLTDLNRIYKCICDRDNSHP